MIGVQRRPQLMAHGGEELRLATLAIVGEDQLFGEFVREIGEVAIGLLDRRHIAGDRGDGDNILDNGAVQRHHERERRRHSARP